MKDVLSAFGDVAEGAVSNAAVQVATPALKKALNDLVAKHASTTPPIHRLRKFVSVLRDDEHFLALPGRPASTAEKLACERLLHRLNNLDEARLMAAGGHPTIARQFLPRADDQRKN